MPDYDGDHPTPDRSAVTVTVPPVELFVIRHAANGVVIDPIALPEGLPKFVALGR